jgi:hypothetical protein
VFFGQLERIFGALETQGGERKTQRVVGFFEDGARRGVLGGKALAHAGKLRSLSGKKEGGFGCQRRL